MSFLQGTFKCIYELWWGNPIPSQLRCAEVANFTILTALLPWIPLKLLSRLSFTRTVFSQNKIKFLCGTNGIDARHNPVPHKFKLVLVKFLKGNFFYSLDVFNFKKGKYIYVCFGLWTTGDRLLLSSGLFFCSPRWERGAKWNMHTTVTHAVYIIISRGAKVCRDPRKLIWNT